MRSLDDRLPLTQHSSESHTGCSEEEVLPLFVKVSRKTNSNRG